MTTSVVEKAKRLIALRDRAGTSAEAKAAARVLAALLERHRLTEASLGGDDTVAAPSVADDPLCRWKRLAPWKRDLGDALCSHYGVVWWQRRFQGGECVFMMCGRPDDVALVRHMFAWLTVETQRLCRSECAGQTRSLRSSWRLGFVLGIRMQLERAREETHVEAPAAALVLRSRTDESADRLREIRAKDGLGKMPQKVWKSRSRLDQKSFVRGAAAGSDVHLGGQLGATGTSTSQAPSGGTP